MKNIILASIVGGLTILAAGAAASQSANGSADAGSDATNGFTTKNVDHVRPFGTINTYNVGVGPAQVRDWVKTLSAGEKQEMVGRCAVIIQNQQIYYWETTSFCQNVAIAVAERS